MSKTSNEIVKRVKERKIREEAKEEKEEKRPHYGWFYVPG